MTMLAELCTFARRNEGAARRELRRPGFWESITDLHVSDAAGDAVVPTPAPATREAARREIVAKGYTSFTGAVAPEACAPLVSGILDLCARGWDAAFVLAFDEAWRIARPLMRLMTSTVNERLVFSGEMFAFCVDPRRAGARLRGVPPHRDRERSGYDRVGDLDLPRHCTAWLALTDATLKNGCIRVVPTDTDLRAVRSDDLASTAVALEARAGTVLLWSGQAVHWGGSHVDPAAGPRVAIALAGTHPEIAATSPMAAFSLSTTPGGPLPPLEERLLLIKTISTFLYPPAPGSDLATVFSLL